MNTQIKLVGPGAKAKLWTKSNAVAAPNPGEQATNVVQLPQQLPILLAGPVVRRVDASQANIWLATSVDLVLRCIITDTSDGNKVVGMADATSTKLGAKLFIHLATVQAAMPVNHLLAYNFDVLLGTDPNILGFEGDVLLNPDEVVVGGLSLPTFFLAPSQSDGVRIAHASCRKFHAPGADATPKLQAELDGTASNLGRRPAALHMTGDQIYSDDVDGSIIEGLSQIGQIMLGWDELFPPSNKRVVDFGQGTRSFLRKYGFTVDASVAGNHLLGFGDYAAMYVLAWSPEIWTWSGLRVPPSFKQKAAQFASPPTRKVLANVPCYMICDDHEVTDDWNLNTKWVRDTNNAVGRRLMANALGAYWAFQAIGNDTGGRDAPVRSAVTSYLQGKGADPGTFESAMLGFHQWHYTAPTSRPTIFLDTRTRRDFAQIPATPDPPGMLNPPPGLLNNAGFSLLDQSIRAAGGGPDDPLIIVSPAPFFGYQKAEDGIVLLSNINSPTKPIDPEEDPEAWSFNAAAYAKFLKTLAQSGRRRFLILGGDVHYGYTAFASCTLRSGGNQTTIALVQATASAIHNKSDGKAATALWAVNNDDDTHLLIGEPGPNNEYYLQSAEFRKSHNLGIPPNWDLQVRWRYLKMGSNSVVADNNIGVVVASRADVSHTLLAASEATTSASIAWANILTQVPTPVTSL